MNNEERKAILELVSQAHHKVEKEYLAHPATKMDPEWLDKRRLLLADLGLHLVQASVQEKRDIGLIKRYLYSILTISNDLVPEAELSLTAEKLLDLERPVNKAETL